MKTLLFIVITCNLAACGKRGEPPLPTTASIEMVEKEGIECWRVNTGKARDTTSWTCRVPAEYLPK
jgi:hypothetical protein